MAGRFRGRHWHRGRNGRKYYHTHRGPRRRYGRFNVARRTFKDAYSAPRGEFDYVGFLSHLAGEYAQEAAIGAGAAALGYAAKRARNAYVGRNAGKLRAQTRYATSRYRSTTAYGGDPTSGWANTAAYRARYGQRGRR